MRALAAFAAVVLVACTLLAGWHKASVLHGVCAEHGEEVHLERVGEPDRASGEHADGIGSSDWELIEGDSHCTIGATSREPFATGAPHDGAETALHLDDPAPPHAARFPAAVALLRLAPKTSPPV